VESRCSGNWFFSIPNSNFLTPLPPLLYCRFFASCLRVRTKTTHPPLRYRLFAFSVCSGGLTFRDAKRFVLFLVRLLLPKVNTKCSQRLD
jgi:hypothetical protein